MKSDFNTYPNEAPMTEPTEAEIEAAARALAEKAGDNCFTSNATGMASPHDLCVYYEDQARAALTAAAQVRERAPSSDLVDRLRGRGRKRTVSLPDILHEAADEIERLTAEITKARLMPIYSATEDQGEDVLGYRPPDGE